VYGTSSILHKIWDRVDSAEFYAQLKFSLKAQKVG